jgi:hypothetical protein
MANKAQQKLAEVGDDDDETVGGITQLIEEAVHKHEAVRSEMGAHGVTMPGPMVTDSLSTTLTGTGRRMQMERQVGDIQEACKQLKVCLRESHIPHRVSFPRMLACLKAAISVGIVIFRQCVATQACVCRHVMKLV